MSDAALATNDGQLLSAGNSAYSAVGSRRPRALKNKVFSTGGPNSEIVYDLRELRTLCRDLYYNNADARTIVETYVDFAIGRGQRAQSVPNRSVLIPKMVAMGFTEEEAEKKISDFSARVRKDFDKWARSKKSTASRTQNYYAQSRLAMRTELHSGEAFMILNREEQPDGSIELSVGIIEPDRVTNWKPPTDRNVMGLILDEMGRPVQITVRKSGDNVYDQRVIPIDFVSPTSGRARVIHLFEPIRPGQVRGVPIYAANIQTFYHLGDLKRNELHAGVVNAFLALVVESPDPEFLATLSEDLREKLGQALLDSNSGDLPFESGAVNQLLPGEKLTPVDAKRPNVAYGQFANDLRDENAFSTGIPPEIYKRKFGSSYTASRAALNIFKKPVGAKADRYETDLNAPVFVEYLYCRTVSGKYDLPGFFSDPEMQEAWSDVTFTREPMGNIDDARDLEGSAARVAQGLSTSEQESLEMTGNDYAATIEGLAREKAVREKLGIQLSFDYESATTDKAEAEAAAADAQAQGDDNAQNENTVQR